MNKNIKIMSVALASTFLFASCSDDFLEVKNPTGEPLEEYYTTEARLQESLTSAYAPLHWPDWDNVAYNDLTAANMIGNDGNFKLLRPIPTNELQINTGINDQNPGY